MSTPHSGSLQAIVLANGAGVENDREYEEKLNVSHKTCSNPWGKLAVKAARNNFMALLLLSCWNNHLFSTGFFFSPHSMSANLHYCTYFGCFFLPSSLLPWAHCRASGQKHSCLSVEIFIYGETNSRWLIYLHFDTLNEWNYIFWPFAAFYVTYFHQINNN